MQNQDKQAIIGLTTCCGIFIGGLIGFLLRPAVFLVGQLPFSTVITRGTNLQGLNSLLVPAAEQSFNYLLIGIIIGAITGFILATMYIKNGQTPNNPNEEEKKK
ncbi:MAG: hypothetical protein WBR15_10185 [Gammaproteobacteria bacterium]